MEAGKWFVLVGEVGGVPSYQYRGGTAGVSQMMGLDLNQRLTCLHHNASVTLPEDRSAKKSLKVARECLEAAKKGRDPVTHLNMALAQVPPGEEAVVSDIRSEFSKHIVRGDTQEQTGEEGEGRRRYRVEYKERVGRHVVAVEDIRAGEEIVSEAAGVSFLHYSHRHTNCHHCCVAVTEATACPHCSEVIFCSQECLQLASVYHRVECLHQNILPGLGTLAPVIRIFTSRDREFFTSRSDWFDKYDKTRDTDQLGDTDTFQKLFNLQAGNKSDSQYNMTKAAHSYYLISLLKRLEFFSDNKSESLDSEHLIIGRFIDHFLRVADDNCHEICQLDHPKVIAGKSFDELFEGADSVIKVVGVAIYPRISLFNNSCDVNTFKYHSGSREVVVARRDIKAGEEISDFYGEYFFQSSKLLRRSNLGFPCGCPACQHDWPLLDDLPGFDYEDVEERYDWAVARVALESALDHLDVVTVRDLCLSLDRLVRVTGPHQARVQPELYLYYSFLFLHGNKSVSFQRYSQAMLAKMERERGK